MRVIHKYDVSDHQKEDHAHHGNQNFVHGTAGVQVLEQLLDQGGETRHDAGKKDNGNTVTNTGNGDLLAQPHNHGCAGGEHCYNDHCLEHGVKAGECCAASILHAGRRSMPGTATDPGQP